MSKIFKINLLKNNRVTDVFIFDGQENKSVNDSKSKSNIHHVKSVIYKDDSILRIKEKIVKFCLKDTTTSELYLYGVVRKQIIHNILYSELTQNNNIDLTNKTFQQYIKNIVGLDKKSFVKDDLSIQIEKYTYIQFINLISKIVKDGEYVKV